MNTYPIDMYLFTLEIGTAQLRFVAEIAPKHRKKKEIYVSVMVA